MRAELQKIHSHFVVDLAVGEALSPPKVGEPFYLIYEDDYGNIRDITTSPVIEVDADGDGFYDFFTKNSHYIVRFV